MSPRIEKAINIFLDAINEGTLIKGDCTKCAVGNLVRVGMGLGNSYCIENLQEDPKTRQYINWSLIFCTKESDSKQYFKRKTYPKIFKKYPIVEQQIKSTDFTVEELAKIERTFEKYASNDRQGMIRGLEAVIKVMLEFENSKEEVKEVFTKRAELILV
jgi:hypothetical protein